MHYWIDEKTRFIPEINGYNDITKSANIPNTNNNSKKEEDKTTKKENKQNKLEKEASTDKNKKKENDELEHVDSIDKNILEDLEEKPEQNNITESEKDLYNREKIQPNPYEEKLKKQEEEQRKKKILKAIITILLSLLIIGLIVLLYFLLKKSINKSNSGDTKQPVNPDNTTNGNTYDNDNININTNNYKNNGQLKTDEIILGQIKNINGGNYNGKSDATDITNSDLNLSNSTEKCILAEHQLSSEVKIFEDLNGDGIYSESIDKLLGKGTMFHVDGGVITIYDSNWNKIDIPLANNICAKSSTLGNFNNNEMNLMNHLSIKYDDKGNCYSLLDSANTSLNVNSSNISGEVNAYGVKIGDFSTTNLDKNAFANSAIKNVLDNDTSLTETQRKLLNDWYTKRSYTTKSSKTEANSYNYKKLSSNNNNSKNNLQAIPLSNFHAIPLISVY